MASQTPQSQFQDFLPIMAQKLGGDGLIGELCLDVRLSPELMEESYFMLDEALQQEFQN